MTRALASSPEIEHVVGVDVREPGSDLAGAEFVKADIRNPLIRRVLASSGADTVVHTDLVSTPGRAGGRSAQKERNVIGTMQLLGACQRAEHVRKVVVRSSTAIYGIDPAGPSLLTEDRSISAQHDRGYSKDVFDAETVARDFGRRRPDVVLTILRMTNVVGPTTDSNMTQFFSLPVVPVALGYDPRLQLLHEDDALAVLARAVVEDHPGIFNVAADGVIYLSQAIRIARRLPLPVLAPLAEMVASGLSAAGLLDVAPDQIQLIVHGRVVDNLRLKSAFGYQPKYSTLEAFRDFVDSRSKDRSGPVVDFERGIFGFFSGKKLYGIVGGPSVGRRVRTGRGRGTLA